MTLSLEETARLRLILDAARADISNLGGWERRFIKDQIERYDAEGVEIRLSRAQWTHVLRIGEKLGV